MIDENTSSFENPNFESFDLILYDYQGRQIEHLKQIKGQIDIDLNIYSEGLYHFRLFNEESKKQSIGKFLVE